MRNSKRGYDQFITQTYGSIIWEGNGNTNPQKCKIDNAISYGLVTLVYFYIILQQVV